MVIMLVSIEIIETKMSTFRFCEQEEIKSVHSVMLASKAPTKPFNDFH